MPLGTLSGVWQFGNFTASRIQLPASYQGTVISRYDLDWKSAQPNSSTDTDFVSKINNVLDAAAADNIPVYFVLRGSTRSYDPNVSGAKGRQTAPNWMSTAGYPGHSSFQDIFWVNDIYGQTGFLPYNPSNKTADAYNHTSGGVNSWVYYYYQFVAKILGAIPYTGSTYYTHTYNGTPYKIPEHPLVIGIPIQGFGGNSEEFVGTVCDRIKTDANGAGQGFLKYITRWAYLLGQNSTLFGQRSDLGGQSYTWKSAFVNGVSNVPWKGVTEFFYEDQIGLGRRGGVMEGYLAPKFTPLNDSSVLGSQVHNLEPYKNSSGTTLTTTTGLTNRPTDTYPVYLVLNEDLPINDQSTKVRHSREENEEYGYNFDNHKHFNSNFVSAVTTSGGISYNWEPGGPPPLRWQQQYRMSMLRAITLGINNIGIEQPFPDYTKYGGLTTPILKFPTTSGTQTITMLNPPLLTWFSTMQGHRVAAGTGITKTPEVFCSLTTAYSRSFNTISNNFRDNEINNIEFFMKQREYFNDSGSRNYGTTVTLTRGWGVNPANTYWGWSQDADYPGTSYGIWKRTDTGTNAIYTNPVSGVVPSTVTYYKDQHGYPHYPSNPEFKAKSNPKNWIVHLARMGTNIGFEVDSRWLNSGTNTGLAFKITFYDNNSSVFSLKYFSDAGSTIQTRTVTGISRGTNKVRTVTFFVNNLYRQTAGNATFWINCVNANVPIMFVRLIKV